MRDRYEVGTTTKDGRFWCAYTELEEYHAGMWRTVRGEDMERTLIVAAASVLRSEELFRGALERVVAEWPRSCRMEFTGPGNHIAWLGQAACCIARGVPEELTRRAWWTLTDIERVRANSLAQMALSSWMDAHMPPRHEQLELPEIRCHC